VLHENLPAVRVFLALQTQWRHGMAGPTGLDYAAIPPVFDLCGIRQKKSADTFGALRILEVETLNCWADRRRTS
jgi:hypothetical protein